MDETNNIPFGPSPTTFMQTGNQQIPLEPPMETTENLLTTNRYFRKTSK